MGSSSAVFACIGALFKKDLEAIREISYMGDVLVHGGTPSGIDNSAVVYGRYLAFRKSEGPKKLRIAVEPPIVIGHTGIKSSTAKTVGYVRENIGRFMPYIERIDEISRKGLTALQKNDLPSVGRLMNENQKLLERIEVSHPKLEELIEIARENGALGAKLSGKGGGGVMFALCKDRAHQQKIREAFENAGFKAYSASLGAEGVRTE
jgi:mevalonate kinase